MSQESRSEGGRLAASRALKLLWLVGLLIVLGFAALAAYMLRELRHDTLASTVRTSDNLLTAVAEDIGRNVELYDLSLQAVIDGLRLPGIEALTPELRDAVLFDRAATARYLGAIIVLDPTGNVVEDSGASPPRKANLADRDYFQVHAAGFRDLYISKPFRRRVTGPNDLVVALSRRLENPDGSFAGVVSGTLRLDYFKDLFNRFHVGRDGVVNLQRRDGTILMRTPYAEDQVGLDLSGSSNFRRALTTESGSYTGSGVLDGVPRIYNYRQVGKLPLILHVGVGEAEVLAGWRSRAAAISAVLLLLCAGAAGLGSLFARELRRRTRAEAVMRASEAQYRLLADHATDVIIRLDARLNRQYVSPASLPVLGYTPEELVGRKLGAFCHPDDWPHVSGLLAGVQHSLGRAVATYRFHHRDGRWVWVEANCSYLPADGGFAMVVRDITQRKTAEQELEAANAKLTQLAVTDKLTGLLNRRGFDEALRTEWRSAVLNGTALSLVLLDVDRFKLFNDRYGHPSGDECLRRLAGALRGAAQRHGDVAARYGGEELALLLPDADEAAAARIAEVARVAVAAMALEHEGNVEAGGIVTVSLGVASLKPSVSGDSPSMQDLVSAADAALYRAKHAGRNRVVCARGPSPVVGPMSQPA